MKQKRYLLSILVPAVLLAIQSGIWAFVWVCFYSQEMPRLIYWKGNLLVTAVYFVILFIISSFYGGLRIGYHRSSDVALSGMISLFIANIITWSQVCLMGSAILSPLPIMIMTAAQALIVLPWAFLSERLYHRMMPSRRMLLLYNGSECAQKLISKLTTRSEKYLIQESVDITGLDPEAVCARVLEYQAVVFCGLDPALKYELQAFCFNNSVRTYTLPNVQDILTRGAEELNLFDTPLLLNRNQGLTDEQRLIKRILDIVIAGLGIVILSPLMLILALAIRLSDFGPAILAQERLTLGGKRFTLYKFRSMNMSAESNGVQLSALNDSRITPVGRLIRPYRLDEIPQLFNVLKGDMSIVGPRPERPELVEEYVKAMPEFAYRLKVKAGITGYAQVYGNYSTDPQDKLLMDLIYISGYSTLLDFKVMFMTLKVLFQKERSKGV